VLILRSNNLGLAPVWGLGLSVNSVDKGD